MDFLLCWVVAPVGLVVASVGLSLLVERVADFSVPWTARVGLGMAAAIVLAQFGTASDATAELTAPAILFLAVVGLAVGWATPDRRPQRTEIAVAAIAFFLLATPFLFGAGATWAGYIKLDDTATWMALTDHSFEFGRGVGDLAPSTHAAVIDAYLGGSYPIGGFVPAKLMSTITGQDVAFTMQPSMAVAGAALSLCLLGLVRRVVRGDGAAALISVLAVLSAILLGYYLWGGVKELVSAALLALAPLLVATAMDREWPRALWVPLGVAVAGLISVLGPGGAVWLVPILLPLLVVLRRDRGGRPAWALTWPTALCSFALSLPVLITPDGLFDPVDSSLTESTELGNLNGPLNLLQSAGLWPSMDFRFDPHLRVAVLGLAILSLVIAAAAIVACARLRGRRGVPFAALAGGGALGAILILLVGSPWVDGKAMATISPALLAATLVGLALLGQRTGFRLEAAGLAAVIAAVVLWGAFLAYQGVWAAPRDHYEELEEIGDEFAGDGPALSTEVSGYGPRHFLRKLDAEGATDLRNRQVLLVGGVGSQDAQYVDLDEIQADQLNPYNLVITRRGPTESRAPAGFELAKSTEHYNVWQRHVVPGGLIERMPLGTPLDPGGEPDCDALGEMAARVGEGATLSAARVNAPVPLDFTRGRIPADWGLVSANVFAPTSSGTITTDVDVKGGEYELWVGGVVFGGLDVSIDGEEVASERGVLNNTGGYEQLTTLELDPGTHAVELTYHGAGIQPGSGEFAYNVGPVALEPVAAEDLGLKTVDAPDYRRLCGERWDWIEAYG